GYGQQSNGGYGQQSNGGTESPTPYSFSYDVLDVRGNDFGAAEESNGEEVQGQYSVVLPDGRLQTVSYSVEGDSGFVADLEYEGEAKFFNAYGEEEGRSNVKRGRSSGAQSQYGAPSGAQSQYGAQSGAQSRHGAPSGAQSQYRAPSGAQSQEPFQSTLEQADYSHSNGGYSQQSNGGYSQQANGGYGQTGPPTPYSFSYDVLDADVEYEGEAKFFNAYGEEEGRSNVKRGRGPTGGQGYGSSRGQKYGN
ncbi:pro-resilin-like, partial [Pollicipes pollicipes]|uniref:pro-resilin-like n=1 Tax=Pollicipes pollicipes TaxID=41117 RepID=UPI00188498C7